MKPTTAEVVIAILVALLLLTACIVTAQRQQACEAEGGVLLKTFGGYECVVISHP